MTGSASALPPATLAARYTASDLRVFTDEELAYYSGGAGHSPAELIRLLAWQLLYRIEPELYERLIRGENIHPQIIESIRPAENAVEIGAGAGRLTFVLSPICRHVTAIEPAPAMRELLRERLIHRGLGNVVVADGRFDSLGLPDSCADLVITCSAFTSEDGHGGLAGLAEMERVCSPGGQIIVVWPTDVDWLVSRGFQHFNFEGGLHVDFGTHAEAVEMAQIFYPDALDLIIECGSSRVEFETLGMTPPKDICVKVLR